MNGRVAVFFGPDKPIQIREYPVPELEPGAVLVQITMAGICGSDLHTWRGDRATPNPYADAGFAPGHEMTGRVYRLGKEVTTDSLGRSLKEGDRVVYLYFYPCGRCYTCLRGELNACLNRNRFSRTPGQFPYFTGAYADYYYLRPGGYIFQAPDSLPDEVLASVNCALCQVVHGLEQVGVEFGDSIVMQGAGGLGSQATGVAREMGAHRIIVIDGVPARLQLARGFGADDVVDLREYPTPEGRIQRVRELTGGRGADVVCDFVGFPAVIPEGIAMLRPGGRYLEVGNISPGNTFTLDPTELVFNNKQIVGLLQYPPSTMPKALDFLERNLSRYPFHQVISHRFPLEQINEAFRLSEWRGGPAGEGQVTRSVIVP